MSKPLRIDEEADAELLAAASWYELQRQGLGADFLAAVDDAVDLIVEQPGIGSSPPATDHSLGVRRVLVRTFPFAVVYVELSHETRILAFAHGSRRPGYWLHR
jgi:plasmid stabilization system protein ParE